MGGGSPRGSASQAIDLPSGGGVSLGRLFTQRLVGQVRCCIKHGERYFAFAFDPARPLGTRDFLASKPFSVKRKWTSFFGPWRCCSIQPLRSKSSARVLAGSRRALIQPDPPQVLHELSLWVIRKCS